MRGLARDAEANYMAPVVRPRSKQSPGAKAPPAWLKAGSTEEELAKIGQMLRQLGLPSAPESAVHRLHLYLSELRKWGAKMDLVAPEGVPELFDLSFADAVVLARHQLERPVGHVLDVGTGGGAPGIPLAILLSELGLASRFTFVEPREKRVSFLRNVLILLKLPQAEVIRGRSEDISSKNADISLARATLPPPAWLEEGSRLAPLVWVLLAREEAPERPGLTPVADETYRWPLTGKERRVVLYAPSDGFPGKLPQER